MNIWNGFGACTLLSALFLIVSFTPCGSCAVSSSSDSTVLEGSTPGDEQIKQQLALPPEAKLDFIRWRLVLKDAGTQQFSLHLVFGESQPNTLDFKPGRGARFIAGSYSISPANNGIPAEVYHLKSSSLPADISLIKMNASVFHLLDPQKKLMVGNGGWSYTLNRTEPAVEEAVASLFINASEVVSDTALQMIFDGRTPCLAFAREHHMVVAPDCFKLKWRLILRRDARTLQPTTYTLQRTGSRDRNLEGRWAIKKGIAANPNALLYQLDPDKPEASVSLLLGDENVLFLLHKDYSLFVGNKDFSYTLNRKKL